MRSATNEASVRVWLPVAVVLLALLMTVAHAPAQSPAVDDNTVRTAEGGDKAEATLAEMKDSGRRTVMRKVAWASLGMILLLIIFVVVVMILSRRMRVRYLGWNRKVKFNKLWDVWWTRPGEKPPNKGKKPDADN